MEGLLVDIGTGRLRRDHVLVQAAPGAVLFLGFGPRVERLRRFAFGEGADPDSFIARCRDLAEGVEKGRLAKARRQGVPRAVLALEDTIPRRLLIAEALAKAGYDPDEPRDARGRWTSGGGDAPQRLAQEDEEARPEDILDPLATVRQALWDAALARLRQIDPDNPNLTYFTNPGSAPSQAALDRLDAALEAAAIKRVAGKVMPGGKPIGMRGTKSNIRELPGGLPAAQHMFDDLRVGGEVYYSSPGRTIIKLPGRAGYITFRPVSRSGDPAVDVNLFHVGLLRFHFPPGR